MLAISLGIAPRDAVIFAASDSASPPTGRVVVKFREGPGRSAARADQSRYGATRVEQHPRLGAQVWHVSPGTEREVVSRLSGRSDVEFAEVDTRQQLAVVPNDLYYGTNQWNLPAVGAPEAWERTTGDSSVIVAVIDSGFDTTHPDRPANLLLGCDYVIWGDARLGACPRVGDDPNGHGTHVAGIVAARQNNAVGITGLAPDVTLLAIRTANASGSSWTSDVAAAILEATDAGADVINLSLGGSSPSTIQRSAVNYALQHGVVVVAAAGNDYTSGNPTMYPAAYPGVLGVGAITASDQHAPYSNTGSYVSLVAPGGGGGESVLDWIASLYPLTRGGYQLMVGTSQAAPHVAAAAGLMLSLRSDLSGESVATLLTSTARPLGAGRPNATYGYGALDVDAALVAAQAFGAASHPTPAPTATATPRPTQVPTSYPIATPRPDGYRTSIPVVVADNSGL